MYRDQLVCAITPISIDRNEVAAVRRLVGLAGPELDVLFGALGQVHFASLTLLPPRPGKVKRSNPPSIALELVLDEGVDLGELVDRLVTCGFAALWPVYANVRGAPVRGTAAEQASWLKRKLKKSARHAGGGYVGTRDRTVRQIDREAKLAQAAGDAAQKALAAMPADRVTRHELARRIRTAIADDRAFDDLRGSARRSPWRAEGLGSFARVVRILVRWFDDRPLNALARLSALIVTLVLLAAAIAVIGSVVMLVQAAVLGWVPVFGRSLACGVSFWPRCVAPVGYLVVAGAASLVVILALMRWLPPLVLVVLAAAVLVGLSWIVGAAFVHPPVRREVLTVLRQGGGAIDVIASASVLWLLLMYVAISRIPPYLGTSPFVAVGALPALAVAALAFVSPVARILLLGMLLFVVAAVGVCLAVRWGAARAQVLVTRLDRPGEESWRTMLTKWMRSRQTELTPSRWVTAIESRESRSIRNLQRWHQTHPTLVASEAALHDRCNHMVSLTELRPPQFFHAFCLRAFLWLVGELGTVWWVDGMLGHAQGIHFAHWHVIDGGKRLLFLSNYEGDFSGYLDEFILGAGIGINLIWGRSLLLPRPAASDGQPAIGHARDFPPRRLLVFAGCSNEQWFKAYVRDSMLPHLYRFDAYAWSCRQIERATRLRDALIVKRDAAMPAVDAAGAPIDNVKDDRIMRAIES